MCSILSALRVKRPQLTGRQEKPSRCQLIGRVGGMRGRLSARERHAWGDERERADTKAAAAAEPQRSWDSGGFSLSALAS